MNYPHQLVEAFAQTFSQGGSFKTINHARQLAQAILGENIASGTPLAKLVDESIERGLVRAAHQLVSAGGTPLQVYERLVDLYQRQPILGTRSSTSVAQQAYSTPLPIAYLASQLAKIRPDTTVYEPTAGNGSLLLSSEPNKVFANELNQDRANDLREQGYTVTQFDATNYLPNQEVDVVIANPPFGTIRAEGGFAKVFEVVGANNSSPFVSTQIDHVIALNSLKVMREDGKAVLILGGKMGDERSRSTSYNSQTTRAFYYSLYNQYNVTRHISIDGDLYVRQGADFPIDVILIEGRGKSKLTLPAAEVPRIYRSFNELKELLPNEAVYEYQQSLDTSLNRTNERRFGSSIGPTQPKPDTELQRVSGAASDESRVDDPARGTVRGLADGEPLHKERGNVLRSIELVVSGRSPRQVGSSIDRGESVFSGEAELRPGDQLPSHSDREHGSFGAYRTNTIRGMAGTDGSPAKGRLDVETRSTQDKSSTNLQSGETMAAGEQTDDNLSPVTEQPRQVPYIPLSLAQPSNTLAPANMQSGMANALARLQKETGSLDEYVASRLNYGSLSQLHQYLNAEQVDAVALAISNLEKQRGFILGDQTGVGKGRVVASVIRYAKETGRIPVFVTQDTKLYADMIRDLADINMVGFRPFVTNADLNISLPDGRRLKTSTTTHKQEMQTLRQSGSIGDYDAIFTTYSQMQSVKGQETDRRNFLRTMAPFAIIIMDESHEAGGTKDNKLSTVPDRAEFARELLSLSQGAVYSSATFAKRPDVMDLYALTDMGRAVSTEKLVGLVERGGIPMQQGLATMLVEAGQYIRRERSYEGVSFDAKISPVDKDVAENMSSIMGAILDFDRIKQQTVKQLDKELKARAKSLALDNSTGGAGVDSTNFTSIMHNLVDQSLLAMKAEATVQECLTALKHNEKPVVALASTMGSFIGDYAKINNLKPGDSINLSFGDLLKRYLERSRDILVKDYAGNKTRHRLTDDELGAEGVAEYESVLDRIDETDLRSIPISPIDYIKHRLQQEGYQVSEVTGRTETVTYDANGNTTYSQRQSSKTADRNNIEAFNSGQIDLIILNRSGATGISLHASERFADQRQRHMIVVQPEKDINNFTQMLGRIHRTGQVVKPKFTLLMADIPAEKRPNAVLLKKMASLNANTTAARKSGLNLDSIPDFLNEYGSQVVVDILSNNPELNYRLASPLKGEDEVDLEKLIAKVTGRVPLLPIAEQETFYHRLERDYKELVERQEAMGESILEANTLDLDARTQTRMEVIPPDSGSISPFTSAVYVEVVDAKTPRKPLTTLEMANVLRNSLGLEPIAEVTDYEFEQIVREARTNVAVTVASLHRQVEDYRYKAARKLSSSATEKLNEKLDKQLKHVQGALQEFPVGERVRVVTSKQNVFYGVVGRIWNTGSDLDSPVVTANWRLQLLVADQARELTVPLSKVNTVKENAINVMSQERDMLTGQDVYDLFDQRQTQQRQERQVFTGNILRAYEAFDGKLVNFTDNLGKIRQGILTPLGFDIEKALESEPVRMPTVSDAKRFITEVTQRTGSVKTLDELLTIKAEKREDGFVLRTLKAKDLGGQYYLDSDILTAAGSDFFSIGDRMECLVPKERIDNVLEVITKGKRLTLAAFDQRSKAREMLVIQLPKLEQVQTGEIELQGDPTCFASKVSQKPNKAPESQFKADSALEPFQSAILEPREIATPTLNPETSSSYIESGTDRSKDIILPSQPVQIEDAVTKEIVLENSSTREVRSTTQNLERESQVTLSESTSPNILDFRFQFGAAEKNVAKLLHQAGLAEEILKGDDFHLKVENEPYIPLSIERHGQKLYLTHFLADYSGDLFIDSEMVFNISSVGQLSLNQTAVQNPLTGGEHRRNDREFGKLFSKNLLDQGFAIAAEQVFVAKTQSLPTPLTESTPTVPEEHKKQDLSDSTPTTPISANTTARADIQPSTELEEASLDLAAAFDSEVVEAATPPAATTNSTEVVSSTEPQAVQLNLFQSGINMPETPAEAKRKPQIPSLDNRPTPAESLPPIVESATIAKESNLEPSTSTSKENALPDQLPTTSTSLERQSRKSPSYSQPTTRFEPENLSEIANSVRNFELETVAEELGLERDKRDSHKWRGDGQIISINGQRFYDHLNSFGSGGAIDLVMHVNSCQYPDAVDWLADRSATPRAAKASFKTVNTEAVEEDPKYLALPIKDETKWSNVRSYLVLTRGLPEALVDALHNKNLIYADTMNNAIFLRHATSDWQRGEQTGANLRGTVGKFHRLSPGTERDKGWFSFSVGKGEISRVVLTESAIDAMSLAALDKVNGRPEGVSVYLSVDGAGAVPSNAIKAMLARGGRVELAFDADAAGDSMAEKLWTQLPGAVRVRPEFGKDWNEQLLHHQQSKQLSQPHTTSSASPVANLPAPPQQKLANPIRAFQKQLDQIDEPTGDFFSSPEVSSPSLNTLRQWYRAARELGKTQKYLERITTVAQEFKAGKPLSDKALSTMGQDFAAQKQVHEVMTRARQVLKAWGQPNQTGAQHFKGKKYELQESSNNLTVNANDRGTIFSYQQGRVQTNQLDETDLKAFEAIGRKVESDLPSNQDLENER